MYIRLSKDDKKFIFFNGILIILFIMMMLHNIRQHSKEEQEGPTVDTVIKYVTVNETIVSKPPVIIKHRIDTFWITKKEYIPDTNYPGLLEQYRKLGNQHFTQNIYSTTFPLDTLGSVTVVDTIQANNLIGNKLITNLVIPEKTITIVKPSPPKRQFYVGAGVTADNVSVSSGAATGNLGVQTGVLYKDKKDRVFGANVGYDGTLNYSLSTYWKIKIK